MDVVSTYAYTKIRQVGIDQGKNSSVFLALDPQLGGEVVVKEIEKNSLGRNCRDFFAEAKVMFQSEHHNVVAIRVASETPTHICLSMPFYKNGSLTDKIKTGPLPLFDVQRVGQDFLAGLEAIHVAGYIHFDVKPSNILFSDNNRAMVADFGQSRPCVTGGLTTMPSMYTWAVPPEFFSRIGDLKSDVYQAGLTLYRAVNGDPHFEAQKTKIKTDPELQAAISNGKFPCRHGFLPHVPKRVRTVIRKAMSVTPNDRYSSASELATALGAADIALNWKMTMSANGYHWKALRHKRPALVVETTKAGSDWNVTIHTEGKRRSAFKQSAWRTGCTQTTAMDHLKTVFESLE